MADQTRRPTGPYPGAVPGGPWYGQGPQPRPPYQPNMQPSGLFPSGRTHPTYREPHPVRAAGLLVGLGAGALWMLLFALVASTLRGYGWWTILAGLVAWGAALMLGRLGDRGVAAGVAISAAIGWSVAAIIVVAYWSTRLDWPLW